MHDGKSAILSSANELFLNFWIFTEETRERFDLRRFFSLTTLSFVLALVTIKLIARLWDGSKTEGEFILRGRWIDML